MEKRNLIAVATVQRDLVASVIKGRLECEGIPVLLQYETLSRVYGLTIDGLGQVKVMVPAEFAGQAKKILEEKPDESENNPE